jgi:hypothetical protein
MGLVRVVAAPNLGKQLPMRHHPSRMAHQRGEKLVLGWGKMNVGPLDPRKPTAAVLVGSYGGVGMHTVLNIFRAFPGHFKNLVFLSVGVVDSGEFKGEHAVENLRQRTEEMLAQYVAFANSLGMPATARLGVGTEAVAEAEKLCVEIAREFPHIVFFAGKMIFQREKWYHRLLHNETALAVETRLRWLGKTMVTLPIRVREAA